MQIQPQGTLENTELVGRLKIGGRWYLPGSVVALDKSDVEVLEMRGIAKKAPPGALALNVEPKKAPAPTPAPPAEKDEVVEPIQSVPATHVPVQLKVEPSNAKGSTGHGNQYPHKNRQRG